MGQSEGLGGLPATAKYDDRRLDEVPDRPAVIQQGVDLGFQGRDAEPFRVGGLGVAFPVAVIVPGFQDAPGFQLAVDPNQTRPRRCAQASGGVGRRWRVRQRPLGGWRPMGGAGFTKARQKARKGLGPSSRPSRSVTGRSAGRRGCWVVGAVKTDPPPLGLVSEAGGGRVTERPKAITGLRAPADKCPSENNDEDFRHAASLASDT
jgi:hypothetical protein